MFGSGSSPQFFLSQWSHKYFPERESLLLPQCPSFPIASPRLHQLGGTGLQRQYGKDIEPTGNSYESSTLTLRPIVYVLMDYSPLPQMHRLFISRSFHVLATPTFYSGPPLSHYSFLSYMHSWPYDTMVLIFFFYSLWSQGLLRVGRKLSTEGGLDYRNKNDP